MLWTVLLSIKLIIMNKSVCPICKNINLQLIINTPKFQTFQCNNCKIDFVIKQMGNKKTIKDYFDSFATNQYITYYKTFRTKIFKENWKVISSFLSRGKAIDIGASFGWFIECAPKNWKIIGIDKSMKASAYARSHGLNVLTEDETFLKNKPSNYELITLHNVFEHLPHPLEALEIFHKALKQDGMLVIAIPNKNGLINRLAKAFALFGFNSPIYTLFQIDTTSPHYFYYSSSSITYILKRAHFKSLFIRDQPIIDIDNIDKRLAIEGKMNIFIRMLMRFGLLITYHLSILLRMSDEIVIYAVKDNKSNA
jgi:2-polyprenyl-3-methyl-5-hydroxy-6-metoxy-1,4-benzoquinol methylase